MSNLMIEMEDLMMMLFLTCYALLLIIVVSFGCYFTVALDHSLSQDGSVAK